MTTYYYIGSITYRTSIVNLGTFREVGAGTRLRVNPPNFSLPGRMPPPKKIILFLEILYNVWIDLEK